MQQVQGQKLYIQKAGILMTKAVNFDGFPLGLDGGMGTMLQAKPETEKPEKSV